MKRTLLIPIAALALVSLASAESLRHTIKEMNKKIEHAFMKLDMDAFAKATQPYVTSDFKYVENGKTMGFEDMVASMKMSFMTLTKMKSSSSTTLKLVMKGDTGTAFTEHKMKSLSSGPDKKTHLMVFDGFTTDDFRKEDGKWKMARMTWTKESMTMDGKPFDPMKSMPAGSGQ